MTTVETGSGRLRGRRSEGVSVFKGIPFAQPPVGDLRWRAPVPATPWPGVRNALQFGPCAMQSTIAGDIGELIGIATHEVSEDCLYLNVWTPAADSGKRPVLVWIHGGGNTVGAGSQPRINGEHLARTGDVVVVTVNYRLGAFGFLHAPELGATGNEALLDQVAGLRWVRSEIGAFGGDPNNVTVFGQSAGGFDIVQLMALPAAKGCFDKAVPMSGSLTSPASAEEAHASAAAMAAKFGGWEEMRRVPRADVLAAQAGVRWRPTLDGEAMVEDAADVLQRGDATRGLPLMIGHTRDESTLFTLFDQRLRGLHRAGLVEWARAAFDDRAEDAVAAYEQDRAAAGLPTAPYDVCAAIATDRMFRMPAIRTADCHGAHTQQIWMYRFDRESPAHDGRLGSCHSLDIPFVWGTHGLADMQRFCGTGAGVERLSERVMASYLAFARDGNPATAETGDWPCYESERRATMLFGDEFEVVDAPLDAVRGLWEQG